MSKFVPISPQKLSELWACECVYCGGKATSRDHLTPQSLNGSHDLSNLAPACKRCNSSKYNQTVEEFAGLEKAVSIRAIAQRLALLHPEYVYGGGYVNPRDPDAPLTIRGKRSSKGRYVWINAHFLKMIAQKYYGKQSVTRDEVDAVPNEYIESLAMQPVYSSQYKL